MSFWGSELTDRKYLKCHFGETFGNQKRPKMSLWGDLDRFFFSYNLSFWGSELTDRKCLKCHFGETFGNQKRPKMSF